MRSTGREHPGYANPRWGYDGPEVSTVEEVRALYAEGERRFWFAELDDADLRGLELRGASFYGASMRNAMMDGLDLTHVQLKSADLTGARMREVGLIASDSIGVDFCEVDFSESDFTGTHFARSKFGGSNLSHVRFNSTDLDKAEFGGAKLDRASLFSVHLMDMDVRPFCDARWLRHNGPSPIDARTVMRSYLHPSLKRFMLDCGVPDLFAEYMIDCARAVGEPSLRRMMQSTFISYGGPDEKFARKLYEALRKHLVPVFFFPETATVGARINDEVFKGIQEHDRVILVCSQGSLDRPGVLNEIQETFDREARDGGATYLLPIMLDDYVMTGWAASQPTLSERVTRRVVADFKKTSRSAKAFDKALSRLLDALKISRP